MPMNWPFTDVVGHWFYTEPMRYRPAFSSQGLGMNPMNCSGELLTFLPFFSSIIRGRVQTYPKTNSVIDHFKLILLLQLVVKIASKCCIVSVICLDL